MPSDLNPILSRIINKTNFYFNKNRFYGCYEKLISGHIYNGEKYILCF